MRRGRGSLEIGAETEALPDYKPTRLQKVVQKVGKGISQLPREDTTEFERSGGVVEA